MRARGINFTGPRFSFVLPSVKQTSNLHNGKVKCGVLHIRKEAGPTFHRRIGFFSVYRMLSRDATRTKNRRMSRLNNRRLNGHFLYPVDINPLSAIHDYDRF